MYINPAYQMGDDYGITLMRCLSGQGVRVYGGLSNLVDIIEYNRKWYSICDNGVEFNIKLINVWEYPVSIPYTWFGLPVDVLTMTYRIMCVLRGIDIDYRFDMRQFARDNAKDLHMTSAEAYQFMMDNNVIPLNV
jgi:hypothetical protein